MQEKPTPSPELRTLALNPGTDRIITRSLRDANGMPVDRGSAPVLPMNQKIRPVSLVRIIQTARFAEMTRACSGDELAEFLRISGKRAEEIAGEAVKIGLLEKDGSRFC
jgi:hypothetical protein